MKWEKYNPDWLVKLAEKQLPKEKWLHEALKQCTEYSIESELYNYFVPSENPNKPGSKWQFDKCISLEDPKEGSLVLDILKSGQVGGIEFLGRMGFSLNSEFIEIEIDE